MRGIYRLLADYGGRIFGDDYFADLYKDSVKGRPTVPARVLATVMILQAHEGLSDREACDRLERDLAWQAACGVHTAPAAFHPTVLVGLRNRLRASGRPRRLFVDIRAMAVESGLLGGRARVLDSTPIYDSVATQDTVTQLVLSDPPGGPRGARRCRVDRGGMHRARLPQAGQAEDRLG